MNYSPRDTPESIPTVFVEAWNHRDPDTLASLFDEDAEFVNVVGLWWHDRAAIRKAHAYGLERIFNHSTLRLVTVKVKHLSDGIAVVHAQMSLSGQTPAGEVTKPEIRRNMFTFVVHLTPEGWSCAAAQNTDVIPGAETHIIDTGGQMRSISYRPVDKVDDRGAG